MSSNGSSVTSRRTTSTRGGLPTRTAGIDPGRHNRLTGPERLTRESIVRTSWASQPHAAGPGCAPTSTRPAPPPDAAVHSRRRRRTLEHPRRLKPRQLKAPPRPAGGHRLILASMVRRRAELACSPLAGSGCHGSADSSAPEGGCVLQANRVVVTAMSSGARRCDNDVVGAGRE